MPNTTDQNPVPNSEIMSPEMMATAMAEIDQALLNNISTQKSGYSVDQASLNKISSFIFNLVEKQLKKKMEWMKNNKEEKDENLENTLENFGSSDQNDDLDGFAQTMINEDEETGENDIPKNLEKRFPKETEDKKNEYPQEKEPDKEERPIKTNEVDFSNYRKKSPEEYAADVKRRLQESNKADEENIRKALDNFANNKNKNTQEKTGVTDENTPQGETEGQNTKQPKSDTDTEENEEEEDRKEEEWLQSEERKLDRKEKKIKERGGFTKTLNKITNSKIKKIKDIIKILENTKKKKYREIKWYELLLNILFTNYLALYFLEKIFLIIKLSLYIIGAMLFIILFWTPIPELIWGIAALVNIPQQAIKTAMLLIKEKEKETKKNIKDTNKYIKRINLDIRKLSIQLSLTKIH